MKFLAILASLPFESDRILDRLKNIRTIKIANKTAYKGGLSGRKVILMNSGIGKVNAAHSTTCIIEHFPVETIFNTGVGGAYPRSGLETGDIAIASKEIYGDERLLGIKGRKRPAYRQGRLVTEWSGLKDIGIPLLQSGKKRYFNEFPLDKKFLKKAVKSLSHPTLHVSYLTQINPAPPLLAFACCHVLRRESQRHARKLRGCGVKSGRFVTVSVTTGTEQRALELEKRFNAICENMEGAAVAHVCTIYKIPMLEIRGISNIVGVRDRRRWDLGLASKNCQEAVLKLICLM